MPRAGYSYTEENKPIRRNLDIIDRDMLEMAEMFVRGMSFRQIAEAMTKNRDYKVHYQTVNNTINLLIEEWRKAYLKEIDQIKATELAKINAVEAAYWDEYFKTQQPTTETITEKGSRDSKVRKTTRTRHADLRCLEGVQKCIEMRCKIFGIGTSHTVNINWRKQAEEQGIDAEGVVNELVTQFLSAANSGSGGSGSLDEGSGYFDATEESGEISQV
jgi:hypothetical protein